MANLNKVLVIILLVHPVARGNGNKYALLVTGLSSTGPTKAVESSKHDLASGVIRLARGLKTKGYDTQVHFHEMQKEPHRVFTYEKKTLEKTGTLLPSSKEALKRSIGDLKDKLFPKDQVYLGIAAHGFNDRGFNFALGNGDTVSEGELSQWIDELRSKGAKVVVQILSCHSGDISKETLERLRTPRSENKKAVCLITSSLRGNLSETCMPSDFGPDGKLLSPYNQSYANALTFFEYWVSKSASQGPINPIFCI